MMVEYLVVAEVSVDGTTWERYEAHVRARRDGLPAVHDVEGSVARDVEHALGAGRVRVREVRLRVVTGPTTPDA
jgi:hypothetical protein